MTRTTTITLFYTGVAIISIAIISLAMWLRPGLSSSYQAPAINTGRETPSRWFEIKNDLTAINQEGRSVRLTDLRGKIVLVAEFFAVCPNCAVRNGEELRRIYDEFRNDPDFQIVCISVDPENDNQEKLADYAKALGAEAKNWWFLNAGNSKTTHAYLEQELRFMGIRERKDPVDIETNGRYSHDMSFLLVDRDAWVIGKWALADARSKEALEREPDGYAQRKKELFDRIRMELKTRQAPANR